MVLKKIEEAVILLEDAEKELKKGGILKLEFQINILPYKPVSLDLITSSGGKLCNRTGRKSPTLKK